ncbi:MAG: L,D-transpeptidase [Burkholderiaceae bacterium]|nr:L,D-transpeptidase [Burkholderiaceae bacterium]
MLRRTKNKLRVQGALSAVLLAAIACSAVIDAPVLAQPLAPVADFVTENPSHAARRVADWALASGDPGGLPFLIVDKPAATLYVFDANGVLVGSSPVLLGLARGDDSAPGIGTRPMAQIRPDERTTPAGRFLAERGVNSHGEDIMWVDYEDAVSMHRVRATNPKERRLERLRTPTIADNRISYGCINVPKRFYERHVVPAFAAGHAVVYVLPDAKPLRDYFELGQDSRQRRAWTTASSR